MTEQKWKKFSAILVCVAIITLVLLVAIQQSWVKHRPIEAAHERANEQ
jgi:hypothetical protein